MDFIEGLPKSKGFSVIMVVIDRLTKFSHFMPLKHPYTTNSIAQLFLGNVVKLYGLPSTIVSDRDTIFLSKFWKELFKLYRVNLHLSTAYHPQSDGKLRESIGVLNCILDVLYRILHTLGNLCYHWLNFGIIPLSTHHWGVLLSKYSMAMSPMWGSSISSSTTSTSIAEVIENRELHLQALKNNLARAQNQMKLIADQKSKDFHFEVGDNELLKLQPYTQSSITNRLFPKLAKKYFRPYKVLERTGSVAYRLALPEEALIHNVFHISQLKPSLAYYSLVYDPLHGGH